MWTSTVEITNYNRTDGFVKDFDTCSQALAFVLWLIDHLQTAKAKVRLLANEWAVYNRYGELLLTITIW